MSVLPRGRSHPHASPGLILGLLCWSSLIATVPGASGQEATDDARLELTTTSEAARQHFWAGMTDALNVFPSRAAMHFDMALEADPDLALARVLYAFTAPGLGGSEQEARMRDGIAALSTASTNELMVGMAFKAWGSGDAPAASRLFESASELMPGDPYLASLATQLAPARGDETDAIARWEALSGAFPELANPHNTIAYQQYGRRNEGAAMASVKRYLELAPDHPNAADSHAEMLQFAGRYPEALAEYRRAAELDPDFNQAYMGAAEVLVLVQAFDGAMEYVAQGIDHAPSPGARSTAMRAMANVQMLAGSRDGAMGQLQQAASVAEAASLDGPRALAHEQMALTDGVLGDGRFIPEYLEEASSIRGSEIPLHLAFAGLAYAAAGQAGPARDASSKLAENDAPFWGDLSSSIDAMVLLSEGQAQAALDALDEANPSNPVVQAVMADAYEQLDRPGAAAALRERVTSNPQINLSNPFWAFAVAHVRGG